jgi:hemolysin activation/secretion protein
MPTDTQTLKYNFDSHQYEATIDGVKTKLNVNLDSELGSYKEAEVFLRQASDRIYTWLYSYVRREGVRILEKRIADNFVPNAYGLPYREGIERAIYAQIEYMINFDGDLEAQAEGDKDKLVGTEPRQILHYYGLAHKGAWAEVLTPEEFRVGY